MQKFDYDVVILGSGPGGYVSAIKASQLGLKVAVVEKAHLGGICLNWGCIPTKALLRTAEIVEYIKNASEFGIVCKEYKVDFEKVIARSREVASKLSSGINHLLKKHNIEVINGHGKFLNKSCLTVTQQDGKALNVTAKNVVIATGARPKFIKGLSPEDSDMIMGYKQALLPKKCQKVIGHW